MKTTVKVGDCFRLQVENENYVPSVYPPGVVVEVVKADHVGDDSYAAISVLGTDRGGIISTWRLLHSGDFRPCERPTMSRQECIENISHGAANYSMSKKSKTFCLTCHTEVTEEDFKRRVRDLGGPGHWLGCVLPMDHEGDCLVSKSR